MKLTWDNSYASWKNKQLQFRVTCVAPHPWDTALAALTGQKPPLTPQEQARHPP